MNRRATGWFLILSLLSPFAAVAADADPYIKVDYKAIVDYMVSYCSVILTEYGQQAGVLAWATADRTGKLISSFHQGLKRSTSWVSWILSAWVLV